VPGYTDSRLRCPAPLPRAKVCQCLLQARLGRLPVSSQAEPMQGLKLPCSEIRKPQCEPGGPFMKSVACMFAFYRWKFKSTRTVTRSTDTAGPGAYESLPAPQSPGPGTLAMASLAAKNPLQHRRPQGLGPGPATRSRNGHRRLSLRCNTDP
jgi:hypothetical protein